MSAGTYAVLAAPAFENNSIFDLSHTRNRDDCLQPYHMLREQFKAHGIEINTSDIDISAPALFELHMDVQNSRRSNLQYVLLLETPQIHPENGVVARWSDYRKIFTWNDQLVDGDRFIKINFPNVIHRGQSRQYAQRSRFCCMISSNRATAAKDKQSLYRERVNVIRWFESNAPQDFDLFGIGWDIPAAREGFTGKLQRHFWLKVKDAARFTPFPSYQGRALKKSDVMLQTRFAICFENVRDLPGYITEKIFDCFFSGCIPVYWGASNVADYIPEDCFIDRRNFRDTAEVYRFLKAISESDFNQYQTRILEFLKSEASYPFSAECFAETIVTAVMQDIDAKS